MEDLHQWTHVAINTSLGWKLTNMELNRNLTACTWWLLHFFIILSGLSWLPAWPRVHVSSSETYWNHRPGQILELIFPRIWDWGTFLVFSSSIPPGCFRMAHDGPGPAALRPHQPCGFALAAQRWTDFDSRWTLESNMAREIHRWIYHVCLKMMHIPSFMAMFKGEIMENSMINHFLDKAASCRINLSWGRSNPKQFGFVAPQVQSRMVNSL